MTTFLINIWQFGKKVSDVIKTNFNSELIYNKFCLKAEKRFNTKESFQCLYTPVILIDSIYIENKNCYPKVFLDIETHCSNADEEYYHKKYINLFVEKNEKIKNFFSLGL